MQNKSLEELTVELVMEYYNNNNEPFFQYADENILWLGPRTGQMISSKKALMDLFTSQTTELSFAMKGITAQNVKTSPNTWEILLSFMVTTFFPNGETHVHNQRMQFSWVQKKRKTEDGTYQKHYSIYLLNIANIQPMEDEELALYARTSSESAGDAYQVFVPQSRGPVYIFPGTDDSTYYLSEDEILYMESENRSRHSRIHTTDLNLNIIHCRESLNHIQENYPDTFLRPHIGYLINPDYVTQTMRFQVVLKDGTAIPIPEKKYTAFRKTLDQWFTRRR